MSVEDCCNDRRKPKYSKCHSATLFTTNPTCNGLASRLTVRSFILPPGNKPNAVNKYIISYHNFVCSNMILKWTSWIGYAYEWGIAVHSFFWSCRYEEYLYQYLNCLINAYVEEDRETSAKYKSTSALAMEAQNTRYQKTQWTTPIRTRALQSPPGHAISDYDIGELPVQYVNGPLRVDTWTEPTVVTSRSPFTTKHIEVS
jgi:hypothetical protein